MRPGESYRHHTDGGLAASQTPASANNYFDVSPTNADRSAGGGPMAPGSASYSPTSPLHTYGSHQHAAARFYMQQRHRHGSNSSLDSASHFIDHRNQHQPPALSPGARVSGTARRSQNRLDPVSAEVVQQRRRRTSNGETSALDDDTSRTHVDDALAASHQQRATATGAGSNAAGGVGRRSGRLVDLGGDDDEEEEHDAGEGGLLHVRNTDTPHTMSRRNSIQDDVCFPMLTPGEPNQGVLDDEMHRGPPHFEDSHPHHHDQVRHDGLPPGFPWTFDLASLEDYSRAEKMRVEEEAAAAATAASTWGLRNRGLSSSTGRDVKRRTAQDRRSMPGAYGMSPDSDDATFYSRRPRKFINVPGMAPDVEGGKSASSRYQRKLALFEGAGSSPPPIGARANTHAGNVGGSGGILGGGSLMDAERDRHRKQAVQTSNGYPVDTKTPLLDSSKGPDLPSYQGTNWPPSQEDEGPGMGRSLSVGADLNNLIKNKKSNRPGRGPGGRSHSYNLDRQYRFTFYSNALANTIHARHLHELPAPGQSFEELFMGLEPGGEDRREEEAAAQAENAANGGAGDAGEQSQEKAGGQAKGPDSSRPTSGLANALQSGRIESNTAPPTGANTPEMVAPGSGSALRFGGPAQTRVMGGAAPSTRTSAATNTAAPPPGAAAAIEKARAMPGGGIRMDQDPEMCTWWLDVLCPTDQEMKMLSRVFGIHPLTTEDILMEETREKIELFRNYYLVCFRSFDQDPYSPTYLEPLNMYVIVFREGTLSFHFRATPHPQNVRRRIKQLKDYIHVTSDWISYALIDDITDAFGPLIQSIEYEVDSIDELVLILKEAEQSDMLRRIGTCRKKVMGLLRLMGNKADVVKGLAKRCNENWSVAPKSDIGLYLSDIQDHLITMTQNLNHYEKILSRSHSNCGCKDCVRGTLTLTSTAAPPQTLRRSPSR